MIKQEHRADLFWDFEWSTLCFVLRPPVCNKLGPTEVLTGGTLGRPFPKRHRKPSATGSPDRHAAAVPHLADGTPGRCVFFLCQACAKYTEPENIAESKYRTYEGAVRFRVAHHNQSAQRLFLLDLRYSLHVVSREIMPAG